MKKTSTSKKKETKDEIVEKFSEWLREEGFVFVTIPQRVEVKGCPDVLIFGKYDHKFSLAVVIKLQEGPRGGGVSLPTEDQVGWLHLLQSVGFYAGVAYGFQGAKEIVKQAEQKDFDRENDNIEIGRCVVGGTPIYRSWPQREEQNPLRKVKQMDEIDAEEEIVVYDPSMDPIEPVATPEPVRMSQEQLTMAIDQLLASNGYRLNVEPRYMISLVDAAAK